MSDVISQTVNIEIRERLADGTYKLKNPKTTADMVIDSASKVLMLPAERTKLNGVAIGAQVNAVTSVAGKTGAVVVTKTDVGLGSVENYAKASQAEAEGGTSDIKYMTPLRTNQLIVSLRGSSRGSGTWGGSVPITVSHGLGRIPIVNFSGDGFITSITTSTFSIQLYSSGASGSYWYW